MTKQDEKTVAPENTKVRERPESSGDTGKKKVARGRGSSDRRDRSQDKKGAIASEFEERVVAVTRCTKVVRGGRRFSFAALLVLGDKNGRVGYALGKAKEVPEAIRKAKMKAQRRMVNIQLDGETIPHQVLGQHDSSKLLFRPAGSGTGIKAAGVCRAVLELAGVKNILTKSLNGNNPHNIVKAAFKALYQLRSPAKIAEVRGLEKNRVRLK